MEKQVEKKEDKKSFWDELLEFVNMSKEKHSKEDKAPAEKHAVEPTPEEIAAEAAAKAVEADAAAAADAEKAAEETPPAAPKEDAEPSEQEKIYLDKIASLEKEVADLKAKQIESETALETMKKETPAAKKITNLPPVEKSISYEEMTNFQKAKFNKEHSKY